MYFRQEDKKIRSTIKMSYTLGKQNLAQENPGPKRKKRNELLTRKQKKHVSIT